MGRIDDAIRVLEATEDGTERALQLAGLISTLFKIKGISLVVTGQLAYDIYANTASGQPELDLAPFAGDLAPRSILEIMRGQLYGRGSLYQWRVADIPVHFHHDTAIANREFCREFTTDHGVIKLLPVEEITADRILAATHPVPDPESMASPTFSIWTGQPCTHSAIVPIIASARNWPGCGSRPRRMSTPWVPGATTSGRVANYPPSPPRLRPKTRPPQTK
jgi:hypothetical protein